MAAVEYAITIEAGATWNQRFLYQDADGEPVPLVGVYTARMQIRRPGDRETVLCELRTESGFDGLITLTDGQIDLRIGADKTETLEWNPPARYNLELVSIADPTEVIRLLKGDATLDPDTTHD